MQLRTQAVFLLGLAVPLVLPGTLAAQENKAKTIAELATMYDSSSC